MAFDILRCTVGNAAVIPPALGLVLHETLGLEQRRVELGIRRLEACSRLVREFGEPDTADQPFGPETERYKNIEHQAYEFLAGTLARLEQSPCVEAPPASIKVAGQLSMLKQRLTAIESVLEETSQLLARVGSATSSRRQYDACDQLLNDFPRAKTFALSQLKLVDSLQIVAELARLTGVAYLNSWLSFTSFVLTLPDGRKLDRHQSTSYAHFPELSVFDMYWAIISRGEATGSVAIFEEMAENLVTPNASENPRMNLEADLDEWLLRSTTSDTVNDVLLLISAIFWVLEATLDWSSINPGARTRIKSDLLI